MTNHVHNGTTNGRVLPGCSVLPPMNTRPARPVSTSTSKGGEKPKRTAATSNRFGELNAFVDCSMTDLSRAELATWLVLWRDTKNGTVRTALTDVARRIGASKRAVVDAVSGLEKRGLLSRIYRGGMNRGVSVYRVQPLGKATANG